MARSLPRLVEYRCFGSQHSRLFSFQRLLEEVYDVLLSLVLTSILQHGYQDRDAGYSEDEHQPNEQYRDIIRHPSQDQG